MKSSQLRRIARGYLMSITFWFGISLLMGWQYRSLWSSYFDLLIMAGARAFSFALWTPPIFYLARWRRNFPTLPTLRGPFAHN